jgi:GT2 family glycosyltransferase
MILSVIIPTLNRQDYVLKLLNELTYQTLPEFEVIVIDQTDVIHPNLQKYQSSKYRYKYIHLDTKGLPNARNVGASNAKGNLLIFFDDTIIPAKHLLEEYVHLFDRLSNVWVLGGYIEEADPRIMHQGENLIGGKITWYGKTKKNFNSQRSGYCDWIAGGNFGTRKDKYNLVGGFDVRFIGNALLEDCDYCYMIRRQGGKIYYAGNLRSKHLRLTTGGVHSFSSENAFYFRVHNTLYFFRKHNLKRYIPFTLIYLLGIFLKEVKNNSIGFKFIPYFLRGIIDGFSIKVPNQ